LDQRRLARTVVANQRGHLSGRNIEIDVRQRMYWTEVLPDAAQLQQRAPIGRSLLITPVAGRRPARCRGRAVAWLSERHHSRRLSLLREFMLTPISRLPDRLPCTWPCTAGWPARTCLR